MPVLSRRLAPRALPVCLLACTAADQAAYADREVQADLAVRTQAVLGDRARTVERPALAASRPAESRPSESQPYESQPATRAASGPAAGEVEFDLFAALQQALRGNREFLARKEGLFRQGLSLSLTRFQFGPQFHSTISYVWGDLYKGPRTHTVGGTLGATQILPTGGLLGLSSSLSTARLSGVGLTSAAEKSWTSSAGASLSQPLLRGFGYDVSHEALTQAERGMVYAIRDFELFRENFVIQVARTFFELVSRDATLVNEEENHHDAAFDRRKAEALRGVDRNTDQEVFRARRRELEALDRLITARAETERALDEFKILLGHELAWRLRIARGEPVFEPVRVDVTSAVLVARHNRLDLATERQRLEDTERAVRLAANQLLPDLALTANYGLTDNDQSLSLVLPEAWQATAGVSLTLPLQREPERNAYRSALIDLDQARRNYTLKLDQLELNVRDQLRRLASLEQRIALQEQQIGQEKRAVSVTRIRYEAGDLDNRDLLEARQSLIEATNLLIRLKVDHFIGRLELMRDLGLLFVDDDGRWS